MSEKKEMKTLVVQGAIYKTTYTRKFEERMKWETPNKNLIYSFIPGTINDLYVKTGDKVKEGETLLLLEAMKMQNQVRMPFDGVIKKIYIKKDEIIPNRYLMMEIGPRRLK
jgi:biotin carboxyl carrier protein